MSIEKLNASSIDGNVNTDFTIPDSTQRIILYGQVVLTTDATVVDRRVVLKILDDSNNVVWDTHAGAVVAASKTDQHHEFMQGIYRETSFIGNAIQVPMGKDMVMPEGWKLRISIEGGVAGDSYDAAFVVDDGHLGASSYH